MTTCPDCNGYMIGVEYSYDSPEHYDGISEEMCIDCKIRIGRWSGKRLADDEIETRYGVEKRAKYAKK